MNLNEKTIISALTKEQAIELALNIVKNVEEMHHISDEQFCDLLKFGSDINKIPVDIFALDLSPAESLIKYMKENLKMKYCDIARELSRDERGIWSTYNIAKSKHPDIFNVSGDIFVPINIFSDRNYSILESLIVYLKQNKNLEIQFIASRLSKTPSTIYTVYRRARIKK